MKKKIIFIINPRSGPRLNKKLPEIIDRNIDRKSIEIEVQYTQAKNHASILTREAVNQDYDAVIAVGGDGTINEVASELVFTQVTLGIIPAGSGNGLARELGIPISLEKAVQVINQQKTRIIDGGTANDQPFFCTAGLGFDAHIGKLFSQNTKRGFSEYLKTVLQEYFKYLPQTYEIAHDGKQRSVEAFAITIANARQYGNNAFIAPQAKINDGFLDLSILKPFPKRKIPEIVYQLFTKKLHLSPYYESYKVTEVQIGNEHADCYHSDGEYCIITKPLNIFKVVPQCIKVTVPK